MSVALKPFSQLWEDRGTEPFASRKNLDEGCFVASHKNLDEIIVMFGIMVWVGGDGWDIFFDKQVEFGAKDDSGVR